MIDELPACYGHELRKARKDHKCCECRGVIAKGETYHFHHGVWDGSGASYKVCVDCEGLRIELDRDNACWEDTTYFTGLGEAVYDSGDDALIERYKNIKLKRNAP